MREINVSYYRACGKGDTYAVKKALEDALETGSSVYFPPGIYKLTERLEVFNKTISIFGAGRGVSTLIWDCSEGGFRFIFDKSYYHLTLSGLSLLTMRQEGGTAVYAEWPTPPTQNTIPAQPHLMDFHIGGKNKLDHGWTQGIHLRSAGNARITRFLINGRLDKREMINGIKIDGKCVHTTIDSGVISSAGNGVYARNYCINPDTGQVVTCSADISYKDRYSTEGTCISHVEVVSANNGFNFETDGGGTSISGCHTNTDTYGIWVKGYHGELPSCEEGEPPKYHELGGELALTGNLIFHLRPPSNDWTGIKLTQAHCCRITGNRIVGSGNGTRNGIVLYANSNYCTVQGNMIANVQSGVWIESSNYCTVIGNCFKDTDEIVNLDNTTTTMHGYNNSKP